MVDRKEGDTPEKAQFIRDVPEFENEDYSVKTDSFAIAVLNPGIKPVYKRVFEGLLTKMTGLDVQEYIDNDKPLRLSISASEYRAKFPRDANLRQAFHETASFYHKNTGLQIIHPEGSGQDNVWINIVDSARLKPNGDLEILFTRSVLPYLNDSQKRLLIMNIPQFGKLSGKYAQKLFEIFSSWLSESKDIFHTKTKVDWLRQVLGVPESYNFSTFKENIFDSSLDDIQEKTDMRVEYTLTKVGRKFKYINFAIYWVKNETQESADTNEETQPIIEQSDPEPTEELVNTFQDQGVSDALFFGLRNARKDCGFTIHQAAMDAACRLLINFSKREDTYDLDYIFNLTIAAPCWKNYQPKYYINDEKPKNQPQAQASLPFSQPEPERPNHQSFEEVAPLDVSKMVPSAEWPQIKEMIFNMDPPSGSSPTFLETFVKPIESAYFSEDNKYVLNTQSVAVSNFLQRKNYKDWLEVIIREALNNDAIALAFTP
ncbi:MAG: replication initiation protein [Thiomicrospira sp.]|nr:replication initiation protein [Thiomicrospira sp.]NCN66352.1 replication initiation protein [Thiomicrospira sp.]NCO14806.1 replication initiation protein [Thiomicrospira sp.]NCO82402.1 replication initiation protein [Thiomicrospira sp.]OIP95469.1 MAG: hypothetical protein AUK56_05360 [Thiomicrospira sp. CG2_30_44_34]